MKQIIFRAKAERDLLRITDYHSEYSQDAVQNVLDDIYRSIDLLSRYPNAGRKVEGRKFRRIVSLKYHYVIGYEVVPDAVNIIGIFRYEDRET